MRAQHIRGFRAYSAFRAFRVLACRARSIVTIGVS